MLLGCGRGSCGQLQLRLLPLLVPSHSRLTWTTAYFTLIFKEGLYLWHENRVLLNGSHADFLLPTVTEGMGP